MRHPRERWTPHMSRREFLLRSAGTAIALPSLSAILAACGRREQEGPGGGGGGLPEVLIGTPDNPVEQPIFDDNPPIESGLEPEPGPLRIYNWADYLWPKVLKDFAKEYGIEYEPVTTFYNEEEAIRKLQTGELKVDVWFPTGEVVSKAVAGKLLQPLNHDYIPNLKTNVWPSLADPFYDQGSRYTVPYTVYQTGIGWRTDMVDSADILEVENPWDVFWNPRYKGIAGLYDDFEEALAAAAYRLGFDPYEEDPQRILEAADALIELVDLVNIRYTIDGAYAKLPEGKFGVHQAWSGDMVATWWYYPKGEDPRTAQYLWPPKAPNPARGNIANDCIAIVRGAEHPVLAHHFLNFMLDEKHALDNFSWVGYQPPQNGVDPDSLVEEGYVKPWLKSAIVQKEDFDAAMGVTPRQLTPEEEAMWLDAWQRVQTGG